jgi:hypothetical protein
VSEDCHHPRLGQTVEQVGSTYENELKGGDRLSRSSIDGQARMQEQSEKADEVGEAMANDEKSGNGRQRSCSGYPGWL